MLTLFWEMNCEPCYWFLAQFTGKGLFLMTLWFCWFISCHLNETLKIFQNFNSNRFKKNKNIEKICEEKVLFLCTVGTETDVTQNNCCSCIGLIEFSSIVFIKSINMCVRAGFPKISSICFFFLSFSLPMRLESRWFWKW